MYVDSKFHGNWKRRVAAIVRETDRHRQNFDAQVITKTAEAHKPPESEPVSSRIVNTLLLNQSVMKCGRWSSKSCLTLMRRTRRGWTILAAQGWDLTNGHSPWTRERWTGPGVIYRSLDEFTIKPMVRQETTPFIYFRTLWNTTVYSQAVVFLTIDMGLTESLFKSFEVKEQRGVLVDLGVC